MHRAIGLRIESGVPLRNARACGLAVEAVHGATAMAADMLRVTCQPDDVVTPPTRLVALANRLDIMLQAVKLFARRRGILCNGERRTESSARGGRTKTDLVIVNPAIAHGPAFHVVLLARKFAPISVRF